MLTLNELEAMTEAGREAAHAAAVARHPNAKWWYFDLEARRYNHRLGMLLVTIERVRRDVANFVDNSPGIDPSESLDHDEITMRLEAMLTVMGDQVITIASNRVPEPGEQSVWNVMKHDNTPAYPAPDFAEIVAPAQSYALKTAV